MSFDAYESSSCSIWRTAEVLGDRWTVLVLRDVFNGVRRFEALQDHLGIARDVLTKRLASLVDDGVLERRPYRTAGERTRHEYVLTAAGWDLRPVLVALMDWGDAHRAGAAGPPMSLVHDGCGAAVHARLTCEDGHDVGPGTRARPTPLAGSALR